ncbi:MAG: hypothetical protein JO308_02555 [Verrucomicrobia bacterium]|nr:hypothetical protein [Verrucomicrobiota bacterium]
MRLLTIPLLFTVSALSSVSLFAQSQYESSTDFAKYAMKLRENALLKVEPKVIMSPTKTVFNGDGPRYVTGPSLMGRGSLSVGPGRYPWKLNIVTTIFWVGERASGNNPVPNDKSSWDKYWFSSFGGYDNPDPAGRRNLIPATFVPRQNPFYYALPYNDVDGGRTKVEAPQVIPWFRQTFVRDGQTVLKDRWIAIRHGNRVCYAQWEDCGPFRTDHWQYVFGNERPRPNLNRGAGLDVSPAVRDYLGLGSLDVCDWRFVEFREVPPGPWALYGNNNTFVILRRQSNERFARRNITGDSNE